MSRKKISLLVSIDQCLFMANANNADKNNADI